MTTTSRSDGQTQHEGQAPFVSTSLLIKWYDKSLLEQLADDITLWGIPYRRLTPTYYAWLRNQMELEQKGHDRGVTPDSFWEEIRSRFNVMHEAAMAIFGEAELTKACEDVARAIRTASTGRRKRQPYKWPMRFEDTQKELGMDRGRRQVLETAARMQPPAALPSEISRQVWREKKGAGA